MKKVTKNIIIYILGFITALGIGVYAAVTYNAKEIGYKNKTVEQALDELYEGKNTSSQAIYGIVRSINSSSTSWLRIDDSVNLVAKAQIGTTAVQNDFDNIYPWSDIKSYNYNTENNKITSWYGDNNFTFTPSGNTEVLTYIPEFYYKREQKNGYEYIYISGNKRKGYIKSDAFSVGRYLTSSDNNGFHSKSGTDFIKNKTLAQFREASSSLGSNFQQMDYHYFIIQLLYLVEYADYNSQSQIGLGNVKSTVQIPSGGCDQLGMKSGTLNNDGNHSMIYRGIEDIYGNAYQFIDGINIKNRKAYVCYDSTKYKEDTYNDATGDSYNECYKPLSYTSPSTNGFIKELGYDSNNPLIPFPTAYGGSDSTYISDYYSSNPGNTIPINGCWNNVSLLSGMWYVSLDAPSSTTGQSSRLLKTN